MSIQSFDDLLELIKGELTVDESAIRYCISPEEKLIITEVCILIFILQI
jgi:hypothetical protein